ncbi:exoribonuclease R [bacterium BRH_c32]|nr:MAG: exoribonuclease R [bacterium BRH_c32]
MKNKIKSFFKENPGIRIKAKELAKRLEITEEFEYAELKHFLHQLDEQGYLEKFGKRYELAKKLSDKLIGNINIINKGEYGFVRLKNSDLEDIFIPGQYLSTSLEGDSVEIALLPNRRGKNLEGEVIKIIEREKDEYVGILKKTKSFYFVSLDNKKIHRDFYINEKDLNGAVSGDKVTISDIEWVDDSLNPEAKIKEILGKAGTYDAEIASIAKEFGIRYKFPDEVLKYVDSISDIISADEIKKRLDLRNENIITIDPLDAKDFDDAVSVELLGNGNYRVGIHIADVSHYTPKNSPVYKEALSRGTSVYLVGKVIPMLPEKLSNNICSLVPYKDRLTYSVIAEITKRGKVENYEIKKSIINSKRRFTYEEVQDIIEKKEGDFKDEIETLLKISTTLRQKRMKNGSINFHSSEVQFTLDDDGNPIAVAIRESNESHYLIEELMLLANQIVASHVNKTKNPIPFVYRIHDLPDEEKITEFSRFVKSLGYSFDPNAANKSKEFQKLLDAIKGTAEEAVINEVAIRSMAKAIYSIKNIGHYGLAFKYYTHFTSPIRRFPDLIVHQLIYDYIEENKGKNLSISDLDEICNYASSKERNAVLAERMSIKMKQIDYLKNKIGEEFNGIVSGITNFGIFVELSDSLAEGLIPYRLLEGDYYFFDEKNYSVVGRKSKKRIRLGDKVTVKIYRIDPEKKEIDFILTGNY